MLKKIIISTLFLFTSILYSQTTDSNEITSQGNAKSKVKPDIAHIEITVQKENEIEKNSIKELNEEVEKIQQMLSKLGFNSSHIKISAYKVSNENRYSDNDKKNLLPQVH